MSCTNCRDRDITRLAIAVILVCWSIWMLIDDVQKLKEDSQLLRKRVFYLEERLETPVEVIEEEEVDLNG